jgi:hypothetical protein
VKEGSGLVTLGYVLAVLMPLVGFIIGLVLAAKSQKGGVGVILTSVIAFVVWLAIVGAGMDSGGGYTY